MVIHHLHLHDNHHNDNLVSQVGKEHKELAKITEVS